MRNALRATILIAAAALLPATTSSPAAAFGDQCYRDIKATGGIGGTMKSARNNAIAAWEAAAAKRYGNRFANWYYSADRTFDCSWDNSGTRIRCTATAGPCGRKR
jgi:uncharacterized protein YukE